MKSLLATFLLLASSVVAPALAATSVPTLLSYQGHVTDASGNAIGAVSPINRTVTFKFYSVSSGGSPLYAETQTVTISGGDFSVLIGNGTGLAGLAGPSVPASPIVSLSSIFAGNVYLGLTVDDGTPTVDPEVAPRQQLVSSAYTFRAKVAEGLVDASLSTSMLADTAVTTNKIGASQVTTAKIANLAITTATLADANVTTAKLGDASVTTVKLADANVTTAKLADANVTTAKIATGAVTSGSIADNTIASVDLADGGVTTADLADGAITTGKIAANAVDLGKLIAAVQQSLCPTGTILPFAGDTAPTGWLLCNGTTVSRTTYAALYAVVGNRFGYGDNSTTFNLPDFRGRFLRGRDGGAANDPDRASRTAMYPGGAIGDAVGSVQADEFKSHTHALPKDTGGNNNLRTVVSTDGSDEDIQEDAPSGARGGSETRPKNAYVNFIIKL